MKHPIEIDRLANAIEQLQQTSTHGWHPSDEMDFWRKMPPKPFGQRPPDSRTLRLPTPKNVRENARTMGVHDFQQYWVLIRDLEALIQRNRPGSPQRMMRDMARGRPPLPR